MSKRGRGIELVLRPNVKWQCEGVPLAMIDIDRMILSIKHHCYVNAKAEESARK